MSASAASSKHRPVAFYAAAWVGVLLAGSVALMGLRQWGWSRIEAEREHVHFADVRETFDAGDVIQAQKRLMSLLAARPKRAEDALRVFGADLLAMPLAAEFILNVGNDVALSQDALARRAVLFANRDDALEALNSLPDEGSEAVLIRARLHLERAEFDIAREQFDACWAERPEERRETVQRLTPKTSELRARAAGAADALFRAGLWEEAASVAGSALAAGATDPGLRFYTAVAAEEGEDVEASLKRYEAVLEALPNHGLALQRWVKLQEER